MPTRAARIRDERRRWAAPGSTHDRAIAVARIALPAAIGVLTALLAVAPLTTGRDISFVLDKNKVQVARERMRVTEAVYRGRDAKNEAFELRAGSAVQRTSADPVMQLQTLRARIALADGPAVIVAQRGRYDMDSQRVAIDGPVNLATQDGYRVDTRDVVIDVPTRRFASVRPVTGTMALGTFAADHIAGNLADKTVVLTGHARLHLVQRGGRAAR